MKELKFDRYRAHISELDPHSQQAFVRITPMLDITPEALAYVGLRYGATFVRILNVNPAENASASSGVAGKKAPVSATVGILAPQVSDSANLHTSPMDRFESMLHMILKVGQLAESEPGDDFDQLAHDVLGIVVRRNLPRQLSGQEDAEDEPAAFRYLGEAAPAAAQMAAVRHVPKDVFLRDPAGDTGCWRLAAQAALARNLDEFDLITRYPYPLARTEELLLEEDGGLFVARHSMYPAMMVGTSDPVFLPTGQLFDGTGMVSMDTPRWNISAVRQALDAFVSQRIR